MTPFSERVVKIIQSIPTGQVASYGQIALFAGNHRNARGVSRLMHSCSKKYNLPWHRVINSQGKISLSGEMYDFQYQLLKNEGIEFGLGNRIDFKIYGYIPD